MKATNYKGAGNHSIKELEEICESQDILLNIRQVDSQDLRLKLHQKQNDINELLDFINTSSFVLNKDEIEAIKLIQKHTKI